MVFGLWVCGASARVQAAAAKVTGLPLEKVAVHNYYLGGAFGRRLEHEYVPDAVRIARAITLVDRPSKRLLNQATVPGPELLATSDRTACWITRLVVVGEDVLGQMAQRARISDDARWTKALHLVVILVE